MMQPEVFTHVSPNGVTWRIVIDKNAVTGKYSARIAEPGRSHSVQTGAEYDSVEQARAAAMDLADHFSSRGPGQLPGTSEA